MATTTPSELAAEIAKARLLAQTAQKMRGDATAAQEFSAHQLAQIDEALRAEGIDPEHVEQEVAALEAQLVVTTAEIQERLKAEIAELERILALARQAQLVR